MAPLQAPMGVPQKIWGAKGGDTVPLQRLHRPVGAHDVVWVSWGWARVGTGTCKRDRGDSEEWHRAPCALPCSMHCKARSTVGMRTPSVGRWGLQGHGDGYGGRGTEPSRPTPSPRPPPSSGGGGSSGGSGRNRSEHPAHPSVPAHRPAPSPAPSPAAVASPRLGEAGAALPPCPPATTRGSPRPTPGPAEGRSRGPPPQDSRVPAGVCTRVLAGGGGRGACTRVLE